MVRRATILFAVVFNSFQLIALEKMLSMLYDFLNNKKN